MKSLFNTCLLAVVLPFAVLAAETRKLTDPRVWSRDEKAALKPLDGSGSFELRHTGRRDWAVWGIPRITVQAGDVFRFSCSSAALADVPKSNDYSLSVVLRGEKGDVLAWTYASHGAKPGRPIDFSFMVPPGGATIEPRLVGTGACGVAVRDVQIVRTRRDAFGATADQSVETESLRVTVSGQTGALTVTDRRTNRTWAPEDAPGGFVVSSVAKEAQTIRARLADPESMRAFTATFAVAADRPEVSVSLAGEGEMTTSLAFPAAFATKPGDRLVVPMNEGISFPADDAADLPDRLIAYGGHGICMAFFGVQEDATGAGWMGLIETPDDAGMLKVAREGSPLAALGPYWDDQKKQFGYTRKFRYVFFDKGGYVAMCKRYRAYAKDVGKFMTFAEKVKERPEIDRLLGAPNIWCWEKDKIAVAKELKAAGIDRFLWSAGGDEEQVKFLAAMPDVLVGRYDVYQDVYHPEQLKKLGWKSGSNTEAWPDNIVWNSADSNDWRHAWGVKAKDGTWTYCAMMCDSVAPYYERRNVAQELKTKPYNTRFIDTTVAAPWQTCWNPAHPMTRSDSRHWKMELLRLLGDEFKLVVGSETGHDASVPYCDYYEGMLSLGPYRVPESGRNLQEIWTNAPPLVVKYQLGEKYRLPLWELVYHECVCAHWYWGDYNNKLPALWSKRDLFNVLYGTMGMYMFNNRQWAENKDRFVRSYKMTSPVARATGYSEMLEHRILTADRTVQQTRFANGRIVTVNFGRKPYTCADGTVLAPESHRIEVER